MKRTLIQQYNNFALRHAQKHSELRSQASDEFKAAMPQDAGIGLFGGVHSILGAVKGSTLKALAVAKTPEGTLVELTCVTTFARGEVEEQIGWQIVGGRALLLSYRLQPTACQV